MKNHPPKNSDNCCILLPTVLWPHPGVAVQQKRIPSLLVMLSILLACVFTLGCGRNNGGHQHPPGEHGGFIIALGRNHYHAEILFAEGEFRLFILGEDESKVVETEHQEITVYIRPFGDARSRTVILKPSPQPGDGKDMASMFAGPLPDDLPATNVQVSVPTITIESERYRFSFATTEPLMPGKVTADAERDLYLTPGGLYTQADIEANGSQTASAKFEGFVSKHDMNPAVGTLICPITETAANSECSWIIGGLEYQFCCPPCVDEFVRRCKENPDSVLKPDEYVKK